MGILMDASRWPWKEEDSCIFKMHAGESIPRLREQVAKTWTAREFEDPQRELSFSVEGSFPTVHALLGGVIHKDDLSVWYRATFTPILGVDTDVLLKDAGLPAGFCADAFQEALQDGTSRVLPWCFVANYHIFGKEKSICTPN
jgi:hypothetical protein